MPEMEFEPVAVAEPPVVEFPAPLPEEMLVPDDTAPVSEEPEPPSLNAAGVPNGWVLQVISYFRPKESRRFSRCIICLQVSIRLPCEVATSKGTRYRVYIGPKLDKQVILAEKSAWRQASSSKPFG